MRPWGKESWGTLALGSPASCPSQMRDAGNVAGSISPRQVPVPIFPSLFHCVCSKCPPPRHGEGDFSSMTHAALLCRLGTSCHLLPSPLRSCPVLVPCPPSPGCTGAAGIRRAAALPLPLAREPLLRRSISQPAGPLRPPGWAPAPFPAHHHHNETGGHWGLSCDT